MVMALDKARVLLAASSVLALAACGSVAGQNDRRLAWRTDMPTFVQSPPVLTAGGILVQSADLIYACAAAGSAAALRTGAGNTTAGPA
jgi:hypothetical protein